MKLNSKNKLENAVEFLVQIEQEEFEKAHEEAEKKIIRKTAQKVKIPGFRQGKAPDKEVKKYVNEIEVFETTINSLAPDVVKFVESHDQFVNDETETVEVPSVDLKEFKDKNYVMSVTYDLYPIVTIESYNNLVLPTANLEVDEKEVQAEIDHALKTKTSKTKKESGSIEKGNEVVFDFKGLMDNVPFEGGTAENYRLVIGSNQFIPGFEDQMVGLTVGEEKGLKLKFPKDYHAKNLADKDVVFEVKIHEIYDVKQPEFNDDFVKSLNINNVNTPNELKNHIKKLISDAKNDQYKNNAWNSISLQLSEKSTITKIPESLIEREVNVLRQQVLAQIKQYQIDFEKYLSLTQKTQKEFDDDLKVQAQSTIKLALVIDKIADENNIKATEEEAKAEVEKMAGMYAGDLEENKKYLSQNLETVKEFITQKKVVDFMIELNKNNQSDKKDKKSEKNTEKENKTLKNKKPKTAKK